ncbi:MULTISPECIES: helix-turn-helix domain-containing protein [Bacteria]|uniref:helix-turn-helix domain-containing protein n=1 Tax=Bacteria TaxID=2 RepID=UPI0007D8384B
MKVEGVYIFICNHCETLFGVVSRFSVSEDRFSILTCPKCSKDAASIHGEGYINYLSYDVVSKPQETDKTDFKEESQQLPELLTVEHIAQYLHVSERVAYEYMEGPDFPLIRLRRSKRVFKNDFLEWLHEQKK